MDDAQILDVLEQIRDEARQTNVRLESLVGRVDTTNTRLESLEGRVDFLEKRMSKGLENLSTRLAEHAESLDLMTRRQTDSEIRLASEVVALAEVTRDVRELLSRNLDDHGLVLEHEKRIQTLEDSIADRPTED